MLKKASILLIIVAIIILAVIGGVELSRWAFYNGYIRMNYPSTIAYPIQGIDISHHQGSIDWQKLDKQKIQFIFIKATEGADFKDTRFQSNWREAKNLNIPISAYHFFTFCRSGKEQAEHFIREVPTEIINLPPAIDLEFGGNCRSGQRKQLLAEITEYIQRIEQHYQQKVIIYATQDFYHAYLVNQFLDNPIWIRDIYKQPTLPDSRSWTFWQYANRASLQGVNGFIDLNVFAGNEIDFNKLLEKNVTEKSKLR